jgi:hypothetical protein
VRVAGKVIARCAVNSVNDFYGRFESEGLRVADIQVDNLAALSLQSLRSVNHIANRIVKVGSTFRWMDHAGY